MPEHRGAFTVYGWCVCVWILVVSFQYGYHISALNQIQAVLSCRSSSPNSVQFAYTPLSLPTCIPMSDATFSVVTSVYTIGGLLGSLFANVLMDRLGRKGAIAVSGLVYTVGAGLMSVARELVALIIGRTLVGVAAGFGICVGPIFIAEVAPSKIKGAVGVLTQFAIVVGIMTTQALGLKLATPSTWRYVLFISSALSLIQVLVTPLIVESPTWLDRHGMVDAKSRAVKMLWNSNEEARERTEDAESVEALLGENRSEPGPEERLETQTHALSVPQLLRARGLRRPLTIVCFSMLCQQLSGVNAVLYYSNSILSKALPDLGPFISLGITIINVVMTFPPIFLIERVGRRQLLSLSAGGALLSLFGVGFGLDSGLVTLASVTIISFVASFAIGLGPVPFVMIPEVSPAHAVSALSSVGLSLNWVANFAVGLVFLPLRNLLAHGDPEKEGRVFYIFAAMLAFCTLVLLNVYKG